MTEYHILRAILSCLSAYCARIANGWDRVYFAVFSLFCGFPALVYADWWKHFVSVPLSIITLVLAFALTISYTSHSLTYHRELRLAIIWSVCLAGSIVCCGWVWRSESAFQAIMIIRQYLLLLISVAASCLCWYLRYFRPTYTQLTVWWCWWLWLNFIMSSTTKGGLIWKLSAWNDNQFTWRIVSDTCLIIQSLFLGLLIVEYVLMSRRHTKRIPVESAAFQRFDTSLMSSQRSFDQF